MRENLRRRWMHAALSLLLSAGVTLPVLGVLEPSFLSARIALPLVATVLLFDLCALNRKTLLCGLGLGVSLIGQEQPQTFSFVSDGALLVQHVKDDHVPGVVPEPFQRKFALADDYGVVSHRQDVSFFHDFGQQKSRAAFCPVTCPICSFSVPRFAGDVSSTDPAKMISKRQLV